MLQLHDQLAVHVKYVSVLDSREMIMLIGQDVFLRQETSSCAIQDLGGTKLARLQCRLKSANADLGLGIACTCTAHRTLSYRWEKMRMRL